MRLCLLETLRALTSDRQLAVWEEFRKQNLLPFQANNGIFTGSVPLETNYS